MAPRTVPYRTVLSVPLYGTVDVRYGKVAYRTREVYGTVREIFAYRQLRYRTVHVHSTRLYGTVREISVPYISVHVHQEPSYGTVRYGSPSYITPCTARKMYGTVRYGSTMYGTLSQVCLATECQVMRFHHL